MTNQFADIYAYRCLACGRVLLTQGGAERHKERCKYITPVIPGQVTMDELILVEQRKEQKRETLQALQQPHGRWHV